MPSYYAPKLPVMDVGEALDIAHATLNELHRMGYTDSAEAKGRAAERLAECFEELQRRINHIILFCATAEREEWSEVKREFANEVLQLANGIAPEATTQAMERAE